MDEYAWAAHSDEYGIQSFDEAGGERHGAQRQALTGPPTRSASVNVFPIQAPPESVGAKCPNCGATVVADQRYCLSCGQPCSPVRLAFLDVLQAESESRTQVSVVQAPAGYLPPLQQQDGAFGWLRRYSGFFGLLAVLLVTGLIGLLVGHWLTSSKAPNTSVIKVEGDLPLAAATNGTSTVPAASASSVKAATTTSPAVTEAQEVKEVKEAESPKAKLKAPAKTSASGLSKLEKLTGKKHQKAIEALTAGGKPIETGG